MRTQANIIQNDLRWISDFVSEALKGGRDCFEAMKALISDDPKCHCRPFSLICTDVKYVARERVRYHLQGVRLTVYLDIPVHLIVVRA
jgi:hypothetical protein